jgi:hypothetical protein
MKISVKVELKKKTNQSRNWFKTKKKLKKIRTKFKSKLKKLNDQGWNQK